MTDDPEFYAWLDGELPEAEAVAMAARVSADPALQALADDHRRLGARLTAASRVRARPCARASSAWACPSAARTARSRRSWSGRSHGGSGVPSSSRSRPAAASSRAPTRASPLSPASPSRTLAVRHRSPSS